MSHFSLQNVPFTKEQVKINIRKYRHGWYTNKYRYKLIKYIISGYELIP
jgi:hypothetical protein